MTKFFLMSLLFSSVGLLAKQPVKKPTSNSATSNSSTSGLLSVSVTTSDPGGLWDPENVLAIWVQDSSGKLVNTMMYFTNNTWNSAQALSEWWGKIGSCWSDDSAILAEYTKFTTDGISGATLVDGMSTPTRPSASSYGYMYCSWGETVNLNMVPDGHYTLKIELANDMVPLGTPGHRIASFDFEKGPTPFLVFPQDILPSFKLISIKWAPDVTYTRLPEAEAKAYSVFPNPAVSLLFVKGNYVTGLEVLSLQGEKLITTDKSFVNVLTLPSGAYFLCIKTTAGVVTKKIIRK